MKHFLILLLIALVGFSCKSCKTDKTETKLPTPPLTPKMTIPTFNRDSAYNYVAKQVHFGPRVPNTTAHQATKNWLAGQLKSFGAKVIEQDFQAKAYTGTTLNGTNIIGQFNVKARKRILLAAHWDSRHITDNDPDESKRNLPVHGADDGASGVGVLLEVARQVGTNDPGIGVDIIFFDAEDYGSDEPNQTATWCLGSQYWSRNLHQSGYKPMYGILLDMVGAKNPRFPMEEVSTYYAPQVVAKVWKLAQEMGYGSYFSSEKTGSVTDDHLFVNQIAKIPMINIINLPNNAEQRFVEHWHTTNDKMENINKRTLRAVGQVVLAVIYNEAMGKL